MTLQPHEMFVALAVAFFLVGPCLGSFASAVAYRVPRKLSWISDQKGQRGNTRATRSACPHCGYQLKVLDLIPILSWLALSGRCRKCHAPVSPLYPSLEIIALCLAEAFLFNVGVSWQLLPLLLSLPFALAQMVIIWQSPPSGEAGALSVQLLGLLTLLALLSALLAGVDTALGYISGAALMAVIGGGLVFLRAIRGSGGEPNDRHKLVWLFAVTGGFLGLQLVPLFLVAAGLAGGLVAGGRIIKKMPVRDGLLMGFLPAFLLILITGRQILALLIL